MIAEVNIPVGRWWIDMICRTGRIGTEEVIRNHIPGRIVDILLNILRSALDSISIIFKALYMVQSTMEEKRLVRVEENKIVGGVCTGVARFFGLQVGKVRLAWLILTLFASAGFWLYVILWLVLPLRNGE